MIPVVGLDVAKGATEGQAFLDKGRPYGPYFQIAHTAEGLGQLQVLLDDLAAQTHYPPTVILESTGHYQPLIPDHLSSQAIESAEGQDGCHGRVSARSAVLQGRTEPLRRRGRQLRDLRHLTRQREAVTGLLCKPNSRFMRFSIRCSRNKPRWLARCFPRHRCARLRPIPRQTSCWRLRRRTLRKPSARPVRVARSPGQRVKPNNSSRRPTATPCGQPTYRIRCLAFTCTSG